MQTYSKLHIWPVEEPKESLDTTKSAWRSLSEKWPSLLMIEGGVKQYKIVFDANMILADMKFMFENPTKPTLLETLSKQTVITPCAPGWLISELRCGSSMHEFLKGQPHLNEQNLWDQWPKILKFMHIDTSYAYPVKARLCGSPDLKDEPYISMANDIGALGVLSRDKGCAGLNLRHLKRKDIRPLNDLANLIEGVVGARLFIVGVPLAGTYGLAAGGDALYKQAMKLPPIGKYALGGVAAVTLVAFVLPKSRKYILGQAKPILRKLQPAWNEYVKFANQTFDDERKASDIIAQLELGRLSS